MAVLAPIFWTMAAYYARKTIEQKTYVTNELAIDRSLSLSVIQTSLFVAFICTHDITLQVFFEGCIVGFFFLIGSILSLKGLETGPGGPVNALNKS